MIIYCLQCAGVLSKDFRTFFRPGPLLCVFIHLHALVFVFAFVWFCCIFSLKSVVGVDGNMCRFPFCNTGFSVSRARSVMKSLR